MASRAVNKKKNNTTTGGARKTAPRKTTNSSRSGRNAAVTSKRQTSKQQISKQQTSKRSKQTAAMEAERTNPVLVKEAMLWIVIAVSIFLLVSYFGFGGYLGGMISDISFGIFGWAAYLFPFLLVLSAAFLISNRGSRIAGVKFTSALVLYLTFCSLIGLFNQEQYEGRTILEIYEKSAASKSGGGAVGGEVCRLLCPALGEIGAGVILVILALICVILITQRSIMRGMKNQSQKMYESARESSVRRREEQRILRERRAQEMRSMQEKRAFSSVNDLPPETPQQAIRADLAQDGALSAAGILNGASDPGRKKRKSRPAATEEKPADGPHTQRVALEIPDIFPSTPCESRRSHRVDGVTNNTLIRGEYAGGDAMEIRQPERDAQPEQRERKRPMMAGMDYAKLAKDEEEKLSGEMCEVMPKLSGIAKTESETEAVTAEEPTRYADPEELAIHIEGIKTADEEAEPEDRNEADYDSMEPEVRKPKASRWADEVFSAGNAMAETADSNAGRTFSSNGAAGKSKAQTKTIRTGSEVPAEAEEQESAETNNAAQHEAQKRRPRSSEQEIQAGIADVAAEMAKAEEAVKPEYVFPPIELLKRGSSQTGGNQEQEVRRTAAKLQQTLNSFGVHVTVTNVSCGPSVTRYELLPEQGVKVSRIVGLSDDIKLNLAAADIRIEAPIPGKAAVGIEVPNRENSTVMLRDLLESDEFHRHKSNLAFAVGKDIGGKTVVADIAKMPHLLIAGATGSGKSVCINTLIMSILYKASPEDVKLIMIDPKVVELSVYNGIPHLFIPVVTDPKKAAGALNWAVAEMTDRYNKFAEYGVRDLKGYNQKIEAIQDIEDENKPKKLPQIVIIVDELADLMMVAPGEVEDSICRLAQLARAAGLHLIIATQRPSVNVITGLIKANMPSRIAFSVSSGVDSRTIIDMNGAEKLLGKGDMLFYPQGYQKPARMQGAFVSDEEVSDVVDFLKNKNMDAAYNTEMEEQIAKVQQVSSAARAAEDVDALFTEAGKFIIEKDKASIGMLQRVFKIGFNRAARIMDQLSDAGVVGPEEGTKPRKILMSEEEFENYLEQN